MTNPKAKNQQIWDDRYKKEGYFYGKSPNHWLASKTALLMPGMRVLVPADGEGRNSVWCAAKGMVVDAFDLSSVAIDKAQKLAQEAGVQVNYLKSSVDEWQWQENLYDAVILIFVNFATPNMRRRLFANCMAALKPGGRLFLYGYRTEQLQYKTGGPPVFEQLYTEAMLEEAFSDFNILEMRSYDEVLNEGSGHNGLSALIGMIAEKKVL